MTTRVEAQPAEVASSRAERPDRTRVAGLVAGLRLSDPMAPLAWLVVPLPLWWVLGLANLGYFLVAGWMGVRLLTMRGVRWPPASGWWLLFCLWLVLSVSMLGVEAEGTLREGPGARVLPVLFRFAEYASATVMLLWAYNVDRVRVPATRLARALAVLLGWTVAGGLLGSVAPTLEITSLVEQVLPQSLTNVSYVHSLVHPAAAQIQDVIATGDGRPSAPFPYTNTWGNALGLLLPWAVAAAWLTHNRSARLGWSLLALVSLVPAVISLNRGLWVGLVLLGGFGVVRLFSTGRVIAAMGAVCTGALLAVVLLLSPLGDLAGDRQSGEAPSDDIRGHSISRAVELAVDSPVLGYGSTRAQAGSPDTIAVGKSDACTNCGNLPIGTNGQLWFVLVGQGLVGAVLYIGWHLALLRRFWGSSSVLVTCGAATTVLALWFMTVYDRTGPTGCIELLAVATAAKALPVVARRSRRGDGPSLPGPSATPLAPPHDRPVREDA